MQLLQFIHRRIWIVLAIFLLVSAAGAGYLIYRSAVTAEPPLPERREVAVASNTTQEHLIELQDELIREFEQEHLLWSMQIDPMENAEIRRLLQGRLESGSGDPSEHSIYPVFSDNLLSQLIAHTRLQPLDGVVTEDHLNDSLFPVLRDAILSEGTPFVVPYRWHYWGIWYNTEVFAAAGLQPPDTIEELEVTVTALQEAGISPFAVGGGFGWPVEAWFDYLYVRTYGPRQHRLLSAGEMSFHHESVRETLQRLSGMIQESWFSPGSEGMNWLQAAGQFESGEAAMYLMGDYLWDRLPVAVRRRTAFIPFPTGAHSDTAELISVEGWAVPVSAPHSEGAVAYLRHRFSAAHIQEYAARSGSNPVRSDAVPAFVSDRQHHAVTAIGPAAYGFPLFSRRVPEHMDPGTRFARLFANPTPDGIDAFINSMEERRVADGEPQ